MNDINFTDNAEILGLRFTDAGNAMAEVRCARTGCQEYLGSELGLMDRETVVVYRPEEAVFSKDSMHTYAGKPVTIGHPSELVTADNWKQYAVGDIGDEVARDGEFIKVPFRLLDATAIAEVKGGLREISMGYTTPIAMTAGTAPCGTAYDAIQTGPIKINHLAIVDKARGGEELRIGDGASNWGASPLATKPIADKKGKLMTLQTVVLGDQAAEVAIADAPKVEQFKADMAKKLSDAQTAHQAVIDAKDAEIAQAEARADAAEKEVLTDDDLDKLVKARADLLAAAAQIDADVKTAGLSDADIRKAIVVAKLGDSMAEKPAAYIDARFDILLEQVDDADPFVDGVKGKPKQTEVKDRGQAAYETFQRDAWKNTMKEAN